MRRLLLLAPLLALLPAVGFAQDAPAPPVPPPPPAGAARIVIFEVKFATHEDAVAAAAPSVDVPNEKALAALRPNLKPVAAPRLAVFDNREATISVSNQHAYVRARDKEGKPLNDHVESGLFLKARPTIDGKTVRIAFTLTHASLADPIAKLQTPRGDIELPHLTKEEITATLELADGGRTTLRVRSRGSKKSMLVTVRASIARPAPVKKPN